MNARFTPVIAPYAISLLLTSSCTFTKAQSAPLEKARANYSQTKTLQDQRRRAIEYLGSGNVSQAQNTFEEILKHQQQSPAKFKKLEVAHTLHDLGDCAIAQRNFNEAEKKYLEALQLLEKIKPSQEQRRLIADTLHSLSKVYSVQAQYAKAEPYLKRAIAYQDQSRHADLADSLEQYAHILDKLNKPAEAETARRQAVQHRAKHKKDAPP